MRKIVKLLPAALALMLISPAFAAPSNSAESTMNITVAPFINIKKLSEVNAAEAQFNDEYTTLTTDKALGANFQVINNEVGKVVYLTATCPSAGTGSKTKALYGENDKKLNIVFSNQAKASEIQDSYITNITSGSGTAKGDNPNCFALSLTPTIEPDASSGAETPAASLEEQSVKYTLKNGVYAMNYTVGQEALANTFSTHDTNGTYQATLTLTTTQP